MAYFYINKIQNIVFYGVNPYSLKMKDAALSAGKNVTAFIDRRAEEIGDINGIPVYATFPSAKSGDCLIIALQNALQHDDIAKQANEHGFERILYVPMNSEIAQDKAQIMRNAYNSVILNDWVAEQRPIPNYSEMYSSDALASALPDEKPANNNKYIVVRVPIDVVYTSLEANEFSDMPLAAFHPYNILFDYFESKSPKEPDTPNAYLERNAQRDYTGKKDVKKTIAMRGECIEKYTEFFQDGLDFALSSAPLAQWNARACFNLCEGHHRTIWLLRNGIYYLPLRISIDDYKKYANIEALKEIRTDVSFINIQHLTPISNPCFNKTSFHNKIFLIKLLVDIQRKCLHLICGKKVFVYDSFWGYFAFNFYRMKALDVMCYLQDNESYTIYEKLEKLYKIRLSWKYEITANEADSFVFLGEIRNINKMNIVRQLLKKGKIVILNLSSSETGLLDSKYIINWIGKLFFNNKLESVYMLQSK